MNSDANPKEPGNTDRRFRLLVTAGPTHEPIDSVRYIANRSSGRVGIALAETAAARGWDTTLLLGPTPREPTNPRVRVERFQTTADLQALLASHFPGCDALIMAAAVADYRPKPNQGPLCDGEFAPVAPAPRPFKLRREGTPLRLELEPTPDLLAEVSRTRRPDQSVVGFALEPEERLMESALSKLSRKRLDAIVANPLETMDSPSIRATLVFADGRSERTPSAAAGDGISKDAFAVWLLDRLPRN